MSCGTPVGGKWEKFCEKIMAKKEPAKALDELEIKNYCCRSLFLTHVDLLDIVAKFKINPEED